MFTGGDSEAALTRGPELGRGLGLFPYGLTDSHFFSRGRLGRLVAALAPGAGRYGLGVADNRGVEVELRRGALTALGDHAALLVDGSELRRAPGPGSVAYLGARVTLLSDGDEVELGRGAVRPAVGRLRSARRVPCPATAPPAWGPDVVLERLATLARCGGAVAAASPAAGVRLRADEQTRFAFPADGRLRTAARVIVDIVVTSGVASVGDSVVQRPP